jgi:hypothetical protein
MRNETLSCLTWRKSSASFDANCVLIAAHAGHVLVRDTRDIQIRTLSFTCRDWGAFMVRLSNNMELKDSLTAP